MGTAVSTKKRYTEQEFDDLPRPEPWPKLELSEGELVVTASPRALHNAVRDRLGRSLGNFSEEHGLGEVIWEIEFRLAEGTIRIPDLVFLRRDRLSAIDPQDRLQGAPDLAVEVVSPSNSASDLARKVKQYQEAGCRLVWVVYPESRLVYIHRSGRDVEIRGEKQMLDAPELLPGWSLSLTDLFRAWELRHEH